MVFAHRLAPAILVLLLASLPGFSRGQSPGSSSSSKHAKASLPRPKPELDSGSVVEGVYKNRALSLSCRIPVGWVLRTDEMNAHEDGTDSSSNEGRVLLAAFSRPPDARGEDVNASIVIAAEPQATYPGLKYPEQYFGPLTEVAKAQGFSVDEEPYEFAVGAKSLVRADFHKEVGSRVVRQATLAMLSHGYAISITIIGGTEDEVDGLMDGLSFVGARTPSDPAK